MRASTMAARRRNGSAGDRNHTRRGGKATPRRSRDEWETLADDWLASGLTAKEFCAARPSVKPTSLKWWVWNLGLSERARGPRTQAHRRRRAERAESKAVARTSFLPVQVVESRPGESTTVGLDIDGGPILEVILRGGRLVRMRGAISSATFADIVRVLEGIE